MIDESQRILINNLKGRISKALGFKVSLPTDEAAGLEEIYHAIDALILSGKKVDDFKKFEKELALYSKFLDSSKKRYVRDHVLPLINKIRTQKWEGK